MSRTPVYDSLPPAVQIIIDKSAPTQAKAHDLTIEEAREALAKRVTTKSVNVRHGTGH